MIYPPADHKIARASFYRKKISLSENIANVWLSWDYYLVLLAMTESLIKRFLLDASTNPAFNSLRPRQDGRHFTGDIYKNIFYENV